MQARLWRPELMVLGGRDFRPLIRSKAIDSSSAHVCTMRPRSEEAFGSSATRANSFSKVLIRFFVKLRRPPSCSSGGDIEELT